MNELTTALRPVKRRIRRNRLLQGAAAGFAIGGAAALFLLAIAIWVPVEGKLLYAACLFGGGILLAAAGNALRKVSGKEAAERADACGLKERAITALETLNGPEAKSETAREIRDAQLKDACEHLRKLDAREIKGKIPKKRLIAGAAALALAAGTLLIPGPGDRIAAQAKGLRDKMTAAAAQIAEAAKEDEKKLSDAEKSELRKLAEDLKRDLEKSRNEEDALVALDKAEKRMADLQKKTAAEARNQMSQAFSQAGMDALAQAVESGDPDAIREALSGMSPEEMRAAASSMSGDAQAAAEQMAQQMADGDMDGAAQTAQNGAQNSENSQNGQNSQPQSGQSQSSASSQMSQAMQDLKDALSGNSQSMTGQQGSQSGQQGSQSGQQGQNGSSGSQGQQPGGGAGRGTTNEEQKGDAQATSHQGNGSNAPEYREGQYETIYDPEKIDAGTRDVMTEQNRQGNDSVQIETGPGRGSLAGDVPYESVVGEYAENEARAADNAGLSTEQREWVDEYFRMLTDN